MTMFAKLTTLVLDWRFADLALSPARVTSTVADQCALGEEVPTSGDVRRSSGRGG